MTTTGPDAGAPQQDGTEAGLLSRPRGRRRSVLLAVATVAVVVAAVALVQAYFGGRDDAKQPSAEAGRSTYADGTRLDLPVSATAEVSWNAPGATRVALVGPGVAVLWEGQTLVGVDDRGRRLWERRASTSRVDDAGDLVGIAPLPGRDDLAVIEGWDGEWWTGVGVISLTDGADLWYRDDDTLVGAAEDGLVVTRAFGEPAGMVVDPVTGETVRRVESAEDAATTPPVRTGDDPTSFSSGGGDYAFSPFSGRLTDGSGHVLATYSLDSRLVEGGVISLISETSATARGAATRTVVRYSVGLYPLGATTPTWTIAIGAKRHVGRTRARPWTDYYPPRIDTGPGQLLITDRRGVTAYKD